MHHELARLTPGVLAHVAVTLSVVTGRPHRNRRLRVSLCRQPAVKVDEVEQPRRLERRVLELDVARSHVAEGRVLEGVGFTRECCRELVTKAGRAKAVESASLGGHLLAGISERLGGLTAAPRGPRDLPCLSRLGSALRL